MSVSLLDPSVKGTGDEVLVDRPQKSSLDIFIMIGYFVFCAIFETGVEYDSV